MTRSTIGLSQRPSSSIWPFRAELPTLIVSLHKATAALLDLSSQWTSEGRPLPDISDTKFRSESAFNAGKKAVATIAAVNIVQCMSGLSQSSNAVAMLPKLDMLPKALADALQKVAAVGRPSSRQSAVAPLLAIATL